VGNTYVGGTRLGQK